VSTVGTERGARVGIAALMTALLAACVAFQLNASMLSPALASIQEELDVSAAAVGLTQTAFFTAAALFSLFLPRLGDLVGRRRVLTGMLALMAVGCVIAALAPNIQVLFVGRVVQGVSGPVVPLCLIMLRQEVREPKRYGTLMGIVTAVNGGVAGVDALAGGYLADNYGFNSVFWVMAVVAVAATLLVRFLAPESSAGARTRMDWLGVGCLVVSVGAMLIALNEAGKLGAANWPLIAVLVVVSVVMFLAFWRVEDRGTHPLVETRHLRQRGTWALLLTTILTMTGVFAVMNGLLPTLVQDPEASLGLSAGASALWILTPYALAGLAMGPIAGRLAGTIGYRTILRVGMLGTLVGVLLLAFTAGATTRVLVLLLSIAVGITYAGTVNIMLNGLGIVLSPKENPGFLPGLNAGAFNLGAGLSFALLYAAAAAFAPDDPGSAAGYAAGMYAGAAIIAVALAASLLIPLPVDAEEDAPVSPSPAGTGRA
jgi:MFS family permease